VQATSVNRREVEVEGRGDEGEEKRRKRRSGGKE
jgi:hypothetical protein